MTTSQALGVVRALIHEYFRLVSIDSPHAVNFFASDATLNWHGRNAHGKLQILEALKEIPEFSFSVATCDCQTVYAITSMLVIVLTGIISANNSSRRFHSSFCVKMSEDQTSALILYQTLAFIETVE